MDQSFFFGIFDSFASMFKGIFSFGKKKKKEAPAKKGTRKGVKKKT
jgi:hypothetical protein